MYTRKFFETRKAWNGWLCNIKKSGLEGNYTIIKCLPPPLLLDMSATNVSFFGRLPLVNGKYRFVTPFYITHTYIFIYYIFSFYQNHFYSFEIWIFKGWWSVMSVEYNRFCIFSKDSFNWKLFFFHQIKLFFIVKSQR